MHASTVDLFINFNGTFLITTMLPNLQLRPLCHFVTPFYHPNFSLFTFDFDLFLVRQKEIQSRQGCPTQQPATSLW